MIGEATGVTIGVMTDVAIGGMTGVTTEIGTDVIVIEIETTDVIGTDGGVMTATAKIATSVHASASGAMTIVTKTINASRNGETTTTTTKTTMDIAGSARPYLLCAAPLCSFLILSHFPSCLCWCFRRRDEGKDRKKRDDSDDERSARKERKDDKRDRRRRDDSDDSD